MSHSYNLHYERNDVTRAKDWKQLYDHIKSLEPKIDDKK